MGVIEIKLKELICKNDNCMRLLGKARIKSGIIELKCHSCGMTSQWRINYGKGQENFDTLVDNLSEKGGE